MGQPVAERGDLLLVAHQLHRPLDELLDLVLGRLLALGEPLGLLAKAVALGIELLALLVEDGLLGGDAALVGLHHDGQLVVGRLARAAPVAAAARQRERGRAGNE